MVTARLVGVQHMPRHHLPSLKVDVVGLAAQRPFVLFFWAKVTAAAAALRLCSLTDIDVHPPARSERGLDMAVVNESNLLVERKRVRVRDDFETLNQRVINAGHDVVHEQASYPVSHPLRVDEQVLEIKPAVDGDGRREANDLTGRQGGDASAPLDHSRVGKDQCVGVGQ
jgi:hypothetical protein